MIVDPEDRLKVGLDVKYTKFDSYDRDGFVYPASSGDWLLFIPNESGYVLIGSYPSTEVFDLDWKQYKFMMIREVEDRPIAEAMDFLCCLYMDPRNEDWTLIGSLIANDADCIRWSIDYLYFLKFFDCEEYSPLYGMGDFSDLADIFLDPGETLDVLEKKGASHLADELRTLSRQYITMTTKCNKHLKKVIA